MEGVDAFFLQMLRLCKAFCIFLCDLSIFKIVNYFYVAPELAAQLAFDPAR